MLVLLFTGICPYNPREVLSKLPSGHASRGSERTLDESLLEFLKETRGYNKIPATRTRGKKISIRPGQQMVQQTVEEQSSLPENINDLPSFMPNASSSPTAVSQSSDNETLASIAKKYKKSRTQKKNDGSSQKKNVQSSQKKNIKSPKLAIASTSKSKQSDSDYAISSFCYLCKCQYSTYTDSKEWLCCISCLKWVCGICNGGSDNPQYECPECSICTICQCDFAACFNQKAWIRCINCNRWVCGICNKGSKKPRYECAVCEDDD